MARIYARVVGLVLVALGLVGYAGAISWGGAASFFHVAVGLFFAYIGFLQRDEGEVRSMVGGMGVLLVLVKGVTIVFPLLLGEALLFGPIEVVCLVVGILSILVARYPRDGTPGARPPGSI